VLRRLPALSLFFAWLCTSGAMLEIAQVFAWTRMFAAHARTESIASAAKETFDPGKACAICRAVSKAREASGQHGPAQPFNDSAKIVLILERPALVVVEPSREGWPEMTPAGIVVRACDVPLPPPKAVVA
jgi:hypothetical protein